MVALVQRWTLATRRECRSPRQELVPRDSRPNEVLLGRPTGSLPNRQTPR